MIDALTLALAQTNPTVGNVAANAQLVRDARERAREDGAQLVVFSELVLSGYPPEDLVLKRSFVKTVRDAVQALARETADGGPAMLVSAPWLENGTIFNAAILLDEGRVKSVVPKVELPNYGVFDEKRLFTPGGLPGAVNFRGLRLGVMTCEDMWTPDVSHSLLRDGADVLIVLNGSPFEMDKTGRRLELARERVRETGLSLVYVNQVGGQDELVFDGASFVIDMNGDVRAQLPVFEPDTRSVVFDLDNDTLVPRPSELAELPDTNAAIYKALVLGLSDYVNKNHFPGVMIGLSGGVDSALTAAVAVDALGAERVHCVMMPSPYTSSESLEDAQACTELLGAKLDSISIQPAMDAFDDMLKEYFVQHEKDTTEENIQSRSRGMILMAMSNKFGHMVLSTGNKSEMSVGYATLYGDMCGGYNVLKDVYKTRVYDLCEWRNTHFIDGLLGPDGAAVPERIITKAPSAELKPNQTDQDSLPPYDVLDDILWCLIEQEMGVQEIAERGHALEMVQKVWRMLDLAEYKRRQASPGVKITSRAFGKDRRYPITNGYTG